MKRKREAATLRSRILFAAGWIAGWFLVTEAFGQIANGVGQPTSLPPIIDYSLWLLTILTFAAVQLLLMRRLLGVEPHRWLLWTFLGLAIGILCDSLVKDYFVQNNWIEDEQIAIYRRLRYVLAFGIPTIFQYFSLPMHLSRRWYWLLAAVPGVALPGSTPLMSDAMLVPVVLQALAILRIAATNVSIKLVADNDPDPELA